jgi:hypothetical protein
MNERMLDLAKQANVLESEYYDNELEIQKFAELIIKAVLNKIIEQQEQAEQNWVCKNGRHIGWEIVDHFGVKNEREN